VHTTKSEPSAGQERRRRHSDEFKAAVVAECARPGVSIARVALRHGLNANLLRRWVVSAGRAEASVMAQTTVRQAPPMIESLSPQFVAVPIETTTATPMPEPTRAPEPLIEVELRRGPMVVKVSWPMSASAECGAWLRELMR
jgi:transposase-like protein